MSVSETEPAYPMSNKELLEAIRQADHLVVHSCAKDRRKLHLKQLEALLEIQRKRAEMMVVEPA